MLMPPDSPSLLRLLWIEHPQHYGWILLMGFLVAACCGWVGHFLMLRRLSFLGDAVSHSILPGVVVAFLLVSSYSAGPLIIGACVSGALSILLSATIAKKTPLKPDTALGVTFPLFFAFGVVAINLWAGDTDLDLDCVLYGELAFIPLKPWLQLGDLAIAPWPIARMGFLWIGILILTRLFYKELLLLSFDPTQARALGLPERTMHALGLLLLCTVTLLSFEAVGSLLGVAMLVFAPATARLLSQRLPTMLKLSIVLAALYALGGLHLAAYFEASVGAAMATVAFFIFLLVVSFHLLKAVGLRRRKAIPPLF